MHRILELQKYFRAIHFSKELSAFISIKCGSQIELGMQSYMFALEGVRCAASTVGKW